MGGTFRGLRTLLATWALILILTPFGDAVAQAEEEGGAAMEPITETAPGLRTVVSIDAEDAYLPSVLSILAAKSGFNIVTGPGVSDEERISIHLVDAPIEEAMNLVVRAAGLSYEIVGNSFLVAEAKKLKEQVGQNSYVLSLQYADAETVKDLLEDFPAQVKVDKSGNKLLIITTPKVITDIERVVKNIDQASLQITLSARLIEVQVEDEERIGINWSKLSTGTAVHLYEGAIRPGAEAASAVEAISSRNAQYNPFEQFNDLSNVGTFWRSTPVYQIALDWLLKNSVADVLANTQVVTMNAQSAEIELVDVVPYVTSSGGVGGQVSVQREEVGIKLVITPQVNSDGYITVSIAPEVSSIFEFIGPDQTIPRIVRRSASMTVRVKNHQSIIVGGLMGLTALKTSHKVPFFGDLPFVGGLFRYNVSTHKKTDLIIEITPHILVDEYTHITKSKDVMHTYELYKPELGIDDEDGDTDK
jgi:type IV pilus assembly protein PilQ